MSQAPATPRSRSRAPGDVLRSAACAAFWTLTIIALPGALLSTAAWFWSEPALFAQLSPFRVQYAVLLGAYAIFCLLLRRWRWAGLFVAFALFNLGAVLHATRLRQPAPGPPYTSSPASAAPLKILLANVLTSNTDPAPLLALIAREKPDLVALIEIDARWQTQLLTALGSEYPFHRLRPREDNFGLALFSREQITDEKTEFFAGLDTPSLAFTHPRPDGTIRILLTHPLPPGDTSTTALRNRHLQDLAHWRLQSPTPVLILGDLNSTPWCPPLRRLLDATGLRTAATDHGAIAASWPVAIPFLRIPLDHALLSAELACVSYRVGPDIGSDHLPILLEVSPAQSPRP